tara:strand:- start:92 stop:271 length:180 start_codon:yes stop_codon:yes gene_type:complete
MNWLKKQMLLNPETPKLRKIFLAVMAICAVLMIAIGQYLAALIWGSFLLVDYLQHRNKK